MNLAFVKPAAAVLLGVVAIVGVVGCAETYTTAPVYRGNYYAYDAYPFGYRGYPAFPYYGAPFGGGASALVVERTRSNYRDRDERGERRRTPRNGPHRAAQRANSQPRPDQGALSPER